VRDGLVVIADFARNRRGVSNARPAALAETAPA
jgi:hypothetical protein